MKCDAEGLTVKFDTVQNLGHFVAVSAPRWTQGPPWVSDLLGCGASLMQPHVLELSDAAELL